MTYDLILLDLHITWETEEAGAVSHFPDGEAETQGTSELA